MKAKKILAIVLCMAVMAGVMTAVAITTANAAAEPMEVAAAAVEPMTIAPPPETPAPTTTAATTTTTEAPGSGLLDWWEDFLPRFTSFYNNAFDFISSVLVGGVLVIIRLVFGPIM